MKRTPTLSKLVLLALRLLDLGKGKSVSQISSEFELSNSDVVCLVMPFVRAGLVGNRAVTEDWRDDVYYSFNYETEVPPSIVETELRRLRDELAKSKEELRRKQVGLLGKEESADKAHNLESVKHLHLDEGKTLSQIAVETGISPAKVLELIDPLVRSGEVVQKYVSKGQFFYLAAKKLKDFLPSAAEDDSKTMKAEINRLKNSVAEKEEAIREKVKLQVLQSLDVGKGKSAGEIAATTGMSVADVVGTMMTFIRSGLIEQSFTPQGFFYAPCRTVGEPVLATAEKKTPLVPMRAVEELASKQIAREFVTPSETRAGVQSFAPVQTHTNVELFEDLLPKLTVRELVLLRERINMELRRR